ncbi:hypothetical protein EHQ58_14730 [Leptospira ognonensis]|uniref:Uncharacterized protein n=1 Tax=Leptospira ognonensis TaxID=2484945 RepID=A0A4V3JQX2_9LEPT|nr:hypothetical protein [Leptospira ognonensis]TGL57526.1 hypothetical protein EHQ58_14730 [Leptospira ognonensis]
MSFKKSIYCLILITGFLSSFAQQNSALETESDEFKMTLLLEKDNPAIKEFEIEFWKEIETDTSKELPVQKLLKPGRNVITAPMDSKYFRVRAVALLNIRGYWTDFNPIKRFPLQKNPNLAVVLDVPKIKNTSDVFLKVKNQIGHEDTFLVSPEFMIRENSQKTVRYFYRLNDADWRHLAEQTIQIKDEGSFKLEYYGVDLLGNKEPIQQISFSVDRTPPETHLQFEGNTFSNERFFFLAPDVSIRLFSIDSLSGLEKTYFRFGCQLPLQTVWNVYEEAIKIKKLQESKCKQILYLEYYSRDRVGNTESVNLKEIALPIRND